MNAISTQSFSRDVCDKSIQKFQKKPGALLSVLEHIQKNTAHHFLSPEVLQYVAESMDLPLQYYNNNVYGTLKLLEAMGRHSVKKLVFSSTLVLSILAIPTKSSNINSLS